MSTVSAGRIIFIHGYAQSASIFSAKTGALRKALQKQGYETEYVQAPIRLVGDALHDPSTPDDTELYGWWLHADNEYDVQPAIDTVMTAVGDKNDVVGLIGFSQGAGLTGAIVTKNLIPSLKFAVMYSGFSLKPNKYSDWYANGINIPNLHVLGDLDTVVEESRSLSLWDKCAEEHRLMLRHQGGHFVPNSKSYVEKVVNWIQSTVQQSKAPAKSEEIDDDLLSQIDKLGKA